MSRNKEKTMWTKIIDNKRPNMLVSLTLVLILKSFNDQEISFRYIAIIGPIRRTLGWGMQGLFSITHLLCKLPFVFGLNFTPKIPFKDITANLGFDHLTKKQKLSGWRFHQLSEMKLKDWVTFLSPFCSCHWISLILSISYS